MEVSLFLIIVLGRVSLGSRVVVSVMGYGFITGMRFDVIVGGVGREDLEGELEGRRKSFYRVM